MPMDNNTLKKWRKETTGGIPMYCNYHFFMSVRNGLKNTRPFRRTNFSLHKAEESSTKIAPAFKFSYFFATFFWIS
jgi:hypothetical protein